MRAARVLVVLVWLALIGGLLREQVAAPVKGGGVVPSAGAGKAASEDGWMGVYMNGRKIGYTHHRQVPIEGGYRFEEDSVLRMTVLDSPQTVQTRIEAETTPEHALRSFSVSLQSGVGDLKASGTVDEDGVHLTMEAGGQTDSRSFPLREPLFLPTTVRSWFAARGLEVGREQSFQVFDPSAMQNHVLSARVEGKSPLDVGGRTIEAWRVRESFRGIEGVVWYDDEGRVLREEGPMGLTAIAESRADAMTAGWKDGDAFDLMAAVAVPVAVPIEAPRENARLVLRIGGTGDLIVPDDGRQTQRDGLLVIRRERLEDAGTFALPYRGERWQDDLAATAFLQADHPALRKAAGEILDGETDARRAAERLRRWVFTHLEKRPLASIPNALQVLEMKSGDCNEHAVLFAALARAAGLPARVIAGVVYADGAFLYHAWNEVWLGSAWVSADAAFDQMPVDATHVKLLAGGPEKHAELLAVMGRLQIEVVPDPQPAAS